MDDTLIIGTNLRKIQQLKASLHTSFHMKDLGSVAYFLGFEIHKTIKGIFINQLKYLQDIITLEGLQDSIPVDTPMEVNVKFRQDDGDLLDDPTLYRRLVGS